MFLSRKRVGRMARLGRAIEHYLGKPDKVHIKIHSHGILFIMQYFHAFKLSKLVLKTSN